MAEERTFAELVAEIKFDLPKSEEQKLDTVKDNAPQMKNVFGAFAKGGSAIFAAFAALSFLFGQGGFRQLVGALMDIANMFFVLVGPVLLPLFELMRGAAERIKGMIDKFQSEGFWAILTDPETWKFIGEILLALLIGAAAGFIAALAGASAPIIAGIAAVVGALAAVVYLGLDWTSKLVDAAQWTWEKLKAGGSWLWEKTKSAGTWIWNKITSAASSLWNSVVNIGTSIANAFVNFLIGIDWSAVFFGTFGSIGGAIGSAVTGIGGGGTSGGGNEDEWWNPFD